jgi:regulator of protease activity HflC (stomatin/prohibitin superfamily)
MYLHKYYILRGDKMEVAILIVVILIIAAVVFFSGIRIVRPTDRGLIETLGKYTKFALPGYHWIIPAIQRL